MSYLKRQKAPKNWPIERKGTAYVVRPNSDTRNGIPVLMILRDILKVAQDRKDVKRIIHLKNILLNGKQVKDEKTNVLLFDVLDIVPTKKFYRIELSNKGKFRVNEIGEKEAGKKIAKIINKKTLKGKKTQINLSDGTNFLSDLKCKVKDSVLVNLAERKIEEIITFGEKAKVLVVGGKHAGEEGIIVKLKDDLAEVKINKKEINILIKHLMVIK